MRCTGVDVQATDPRMPIVAGSHVSVRWPRQQHAVVLKNHLVEAPEVLEVLIFEENVLEVSVLGRWLVSRSE